jgi:hypothetical protein
VPGGSSAVLEVFLPPGNLRQLRPDQTEFLAHACQALADLFERDVRRKQENHARFLAQLASFSLTVHASLEGKVVAYTLANELRSLCNCDRVSVVTRRGTRWRVEAVSGVDAAEPRSELVRSIERMVTRVIATGEDLWSEGQVAELPPQVAAVVADYFDVTFAKAAAVMVLREPVRPDATSVKGPDEEAEEHGRATELGRIIGALVLESLEGGELTRVTRDQAELARPHAAAALANALAVDRLFLMPLWRALGRASWMVRSRTLPKTLAVLTAIVVVTLALVFVPAEFHLVASGTLEPEVRREVFADTPGVVDSVQIVHGQPVAPGTLLIKLRNDELELELTAITSQLEETNQKIRGLRAALSRRDGLPPEQRAALSGDLKTAEATLTGLQVRQELLARRVAGLRVTSPVAGQVVTWDVDRLLQARPVERGQVLLSVAEPNGDWLLDLSVPERRMGHVSRAWRDAQAAGRPLEVSFVLATDPSVSRTGIVQEICDRADPDSEDGQTVRVRVAFDRQNLPEELLRPGAIVSAKIDCGHRPLGYIWLHDLIDWARREVLFRL